MFVESFL